MKSIGYIFWVVIFWGCSNSSDTQKKTTDATALTKHSTVKESTSTSKKIETIDTLVDVKEKSHIFSTKNIKELKVLSLEKKNAIDPSDNEFNDKCRIWNLGKKDIEKIINQSELIDNHAFQYLYYVLPCEISGIVRINKQQFNYIVNAGSYIKLVDTDTTYILGYNKKDWKDFFLINREEY